ncbi:MAG: hypothetical protein ACRCZA_15455 [Shewanella sp.]|uniref:hypothetical protein n=1 Tax=Shewanella sp. TaxID=50422 RepID=UPI003F2AA5DD
MIEEQTKDPMSECALGWERVINAFFADKIETDFAKYLKDIFKNMGSAYEKEGLLVKQDIAFIFDARKNKKNRWRKRNCIYFRANCFAARN